MDKAEALAYVSRLFDAAQAGAVLWGDALLIKRFIAQCGLTSSKGTKMRIGMKSASSRVGVTGIIPTCVCGNKWMRD